MVAFLHTGHAVAHRRTDTFLSIRKRETAIPKMEIGLLRLKLALFELPFPYILKMIDLFVRREFSLMIPLKGNHFAAIL